MEILVKGSDTAGAEPLLQPPDPHGIEILPLSRHDGFRDVIAAVLPDYRGRHLVQKSFQIRRDIPVISRVIEVHPLQHNQSPDDSRLVIRQPHGCPGMAAIDFKDPGLLLI